MKAAIDLDELMRKADWATRGSATSRDLNDARVDPWTLLALIERVRTAERERDALRPVVEAVAGASMDQSIGSVKVFTVTPVTPDGIASRWLPVAARVALEASKEGK